MLSNVLEDQLKLENLKFIKFEFKFEVELRLRMQIKSTAGSAVSAKRMLCGCLSPGPEVSEWIG